VNEAQISVAVLANRPVWAEGRDGEWAWRLMGILAARREKAGARFTLERFQVGSPGSISADKQNELTSIQGTISRITYQHPESHYTVARLDEDGGLAATVVGVLFPVPEGEEISHRRLEAPSSFWTAISGRSMDQGRSSDARRHRKYRARA
jgi:hypothetical protein